MFPPPPPSFPLPPTWLLNQLSESSQKLLLIAKASVPSLPPRPPLSPPKPKSKNPPVTSVEYPTMTNVPISIKPQGVYTGGNFATDITWRNYWNAQARGEKTYQVVPLTFNAPPPLPQYSDLSVAQRQLFRKKRNEGASWEEALNAARSSR